MRLPGEQAIALYEGVAALDEAIATLRQLDRRSPLSLSPALTYGVQDWVAVMGLRGLRGGADHQGNDQGYYTRNYGRRQGEGFGIDAYQRQSAAAIVMAWVVNDGDPLRSIQTALLDPAFQVIGVGCAPHSSRDVICSISVAEEFIADDPNLAAVELVAEPMVEPVAEPVTEPMAEPVTEPMTAPASTPITEPEKPATETLSATQNPPSDRPLAGSTTPEEPDTQHRLNHPNPLTQPIASAITSPIRPLRLKPMPKRSSPKPIGCDRTLPPMLKNWSPCSIATTATKSNWRKLPFCMKHRRVSHRCMRRSRCYATPIRFPRSTTPSVSNKPPVITLRIWALSVWSVMWEPISVCPVSGRYVTARSRIFRAKILAISTIQSIRRSGMC
ncbi:MAG: hypothetical protein HC795_14870 [Coleofasciculaceae cyanobacterium RL_1_1]|nr:hypothetical protein [Coleofasciculaceae cyanobacterium RL_1_1]